MPPTRRLTTSSASHPEVPEVVVDGAREVRRGERGNPRGIRAAQRADLGHDYEVIGIGMKRLANELVGDVRWCRYG
jgi:hypothetical protein